MAPRLTTVSKDEILAVNEAAAINKYQERDKIWLVCVYWSVEKNFLTEFATNHKKRSWKHCQLKCKQTLTQLRLLFTKSSFLIFIQLIW